MAQIQEVMTEVLVDIKGWGIGKRATLRVFGERRTLDYYERYVLFIR